MPVYLHDIPLDQALEKLRQTLEENELWRVLGHEVIALDEAALGRITAEPVWARLSSPHYHASAMDGFALYSDSTIGAKPSIPVTLRVGDQASYVDTGDPLPGWANAVVPIENVEAVKEDGTSDPDLRHPYAVRLREALTPWAHVRPMGEDIVATELVLPAGHVLRPVDLGAIAASGHSQVVVSRKPRVAILPTGSELVPIGEQVKHGDIIEYNSLVLAAQVKNWGGEPVRFSIIPDCLEKISAQVQEAANTCDLVLLNAGSSAGSEDFSAQVVENLGVLLVHGVAVRPGHPVILGLIRRNPGEGVAVIIGVPGYPVSAALTGEIFVEPLLARWLGRVNPPPLEIEAALTRKVTSPAGDDDFVRVVVGKVGERVLAAPLSRGAGVITSLVRADGLMVLPRGVQGLDAGAKVKVRLVRSTADIDRTIFVIGSHDLTLDLLAQFLADPGKGGHTRRLVSANAGSLGGLVALRRGEAHLAGSHLLDPATGEYNLSYIRQYLPQIPVCIMAWVGRVQGLLVRQGNPQHIISLGDLTRPDVRFVNRQRGAGTRVLLDYHLQATGIPAQTIKGYEAEEYTHLAVAAAVSSGRADCGLGIMAAARALDLDFIPLYTERYDLVIPCHFFEDDLLKPLFDLAHSKSFRRVVQSLDGYDISKMGQIVRHC